MTTIEGTLKIQFGVQENVSPEVLKNLNERLKITVEAFSSEIEEIIDIEDLTLDSVDPLIIEDKLEIVED